MKLTSLSILCVAAGLTLIAPASAATYSITTVTRAGFDQLSFWDINNAGLVTGFAVYAGNSVRTGFVYDSHTHVFTDLTGPTGAIGSFATGISDTGVVVGKYFTEAGPPQGISFIYEGGHYTDFNVPGTMSTTLRGISPDARYLTGTYDDDNLGFVFDRDTSTFVTIGDNMVVQGINGNGIVAGSVVATTPFLYDIASHVRTDYTPLTDAYRDVNDDGIVTGFGYRDGFEQYVGIVGAAGGVSVLNVEGSFGTTGYGINNEATVVGFYNRADETRGAFIATVVPEPGAWALLLCGLAGLAAWRRRTDSPA